MIHAAHIAASVYYRAAVIDAATGAEVSTLPRKRNLILDGGLDMVAVQRWHDCIRYAAAGSGNTPTRRASGAVTFTRAGNIVTASAGFFEAPDVNRLLKLDSGEELRITAYTSPTQVSTATAGALAASPGTVWYVNQTTLVAELRRTQTYGTGGADNAVTLNTGAGTLTQKRTFIFPAETALVTYREIGWSPDGGLNDPLFGRDVLPGVGLTLTAGQQLKVVLELVLTPALLVPEAANPIAWDGGGAFQQYETLHWDAYFNPNYAQNVEIFVSEGADAFRAPVVTTDYAPAGRDLAGTHWRVPSTASAYVGGSYERLFSGYFDLNTANSAALRSAGFGWNYFGTLFAALRVRFAANQEKTSDESLRLDFRHSWGRTLVN